MEKKIKDKELIERYIDGEKDAIDELISRHQSRVTNYIKMLVKDEDVSKDIFQETIIKALNYIDNGKYTESGRFVSWLLRIAHNQSIDHFRDIKRAAHINEGDAGYDILSVQPSMDESVVNSMERSQLKGVIQEMIDHLPEDQREVVLLRYYDGLSFKEIAEQTDVSINTALGRMRYALINLRKLVEAKKIILY